MMVRTVRRRPRMFPRMPKEQTHWTRTQVSLAGLATLATPTSTVIFDPSTVFADVEDAEFTIRAIKLNLEGGLGLTAAAANFNLAIFLGVGLLDPTATVPDPFLSNTRSRQFDWMWLGSAPLTDIVSLAAGITVSNFDPDFINPLIRAQRKATQDYQLRLFGTLILTAGTTPTIGFAALQGTASVLWQQHQRR